MPRRANSSAHPLWIAGAIVVLLLSIAGGYFFFKTANDPYRTLTALDVRAYLENSNSLRGNVYKLDATVADALAWSPVAGRLYSVEVESGNDVLAVMIPAQFNQLNIQKGQRFYFRLEVGERGILQVKDLKKV